MGAELLKLPQTPAGKTHLRLCVKMAGGWKFPDGTNAADFDWDAAAVEVERDTAAYDCWLADQTEKGRA